MRRFLAAAAVTAVLAGTALWWSLRREPSAALLDDPDLAFSVQPSGAGRLFRLQDARTPLRAFHWLQPLPGDVLAAQMLGQNDRQRVALFQGGRVQNALLVLKPEGVGAGFWRFAALRDAAVAPGGTVLLLYQAGDTAGTEPSVVLAVDLASQQEVWSCRGAFVRMALAQGANPAVYLFGGANPVLRIALPTAAGPFPLHPTPETIELPPEVAAVDDLLPTAKGTFLVSHGAGLSAYRSGTGWTHQPAPEEQGVPCRGWKSSLVREGEELWWQAAPGSLIKVRPDGSPVQSWRAQLPDGDPYALDAGLLRVLGADPAGYLWFAPAAPIPGEPAPAAAPAAETAETAKAAETAPPAGAAAAESAAPAVPAPDWSAYAAAGLDRLYRWDPSTGTLQRVALGKVWAGLDPPSTVRPPALDQGVAPPAGALLAEGSRCAWLVPLQALPLERIPGGAGTPRQAQAR